MTRIVSIIMSVMLIFTFLPAVSAETVTPPTLEIKEQPSENNAYTVTIELTADKSLADKATLLRAYVKRENGVYSYTDLIWAEEGKLDNNGKCTFAVDMASYDSETYEFVATVSKSSSAASKDLIYYNKEEKNNLWIKIQTALENKDTDNIDGIGWVIENRWEYLELQMTKGAFLTDESNENKKAEFFERLFKTNIVNLEKFTEYFNLILELMLINDISSTDDAVTELNKIFEAYQIDEIDCYQVYENDTNDTIQDAVCNYFKTEKIAADAIKTAFESAVVLKLLAEQADTSLWQAYKTVLDNYSTEIGITFEIYNSLSDKQTVITNMINEHDTYKIITDVKKAFNEKCDAQKQSEDDAKLEDGDNAYTPDDGGGGSGAGITKPQKPALDPSAEDKEQVNTQENPQGSVSATKFNDTQSHAWASEAINYLAERNIINGVGDNKFAPDKQVTRAELTKMIVVAMGLSTDNVKGTFDDVKEDAWYYKYIAAANAKGIVNGISEKTFAPDSFVSRQDLVVMLNRTLENVTAAQSKTFADESQISPYALEAVKNMASLGIISGRDTNCFDPHTGATRAETAKILFNLLTKGGGIAQ